MAATGVTMSSKVLAKRRKEMNTRPGTRVLLMKENDKIILQPVSSFTEKLAGITRQSFGKTP